MKFTAKTPGRTGVRPAVRSGLLLLILASVSTGVSAQPKEKSAVIVYGGALSLDKGLGTRIYEGGFGDYYTSGQVGFHADVVHVSREENATYAAIGTSFNLTSNLRPKIVIGSSTNNLGILPDQFAALTMRYKPGTGWVVTPGLTYRHYRNHVMETIGSIGVAKYFKGSWDSHGYYVVQGSVATSLGGSVRGQSSATVGIQTVRNGGISLGLSAEFGGLIRDPVAGATTGSYWAVRPSVSVPLLHGFEVFARGECAETQAFTAAGGSTGLKVEF